MQIRREQVVRIGEVFGHKKFHKKIKVIFYKHVFMQLRWYDNFLQIVIFGMRCCIQLWNGTNITVFLTSILVIIIYNFYIEHIAM